MSALKHTHKLAPVRVIAILKPFADEDIGRVVVKCFADEIVIFARGLGSCIGE